MYGMHMILSVIGYWCDCLIIMHIMMARLAVKSNGESLPTLSQHHNNDNHSNNHTQVHTNNHDHVASILINIQANDTITLSLTVD